MENNRDSARGVWRFLDGSVSISISMILAVALNHCWFCAGTPGLGFLYQLTNRNDGIIIVATMLLLPTTAVMYGGFKMYFAAKEQYERRKAERLRQEEERKAELLRQEAARARQDRRRERQARRRDRDNARQEGAQEERQRISNLLAEHGVALPPELARSLAGDTD